MEYIVGQFEAMTAHLSVPKPQSKVTDEELFANAEPEQSPGISGEVEEVEKKDEEKETLDGERQHHQAYVKEVGNCVAGV
jgi:hypothetical protein